MKLRNTFTLFCAFSAGILLWGCGSSSNTSGPQTAQTAFAHARALYAKGDYLEASQALDLVKMQFGGSSIADSAEFLLGECNFKMDKFILAAYEYNVVRRVYSSSPLARISQFKIAESYYNLSPDPGLDQDYTQKAIDEFQSYLEIYGNTHDASGEADSLTALANQRIKELHSKLGEKNYNIAQLYYKMDHYSSVIIYCDIVLEKFYDTEYADRSLYLKIQALVEWKRYNEANREIGRFEKVYAASPLLPNVQSIQSSISDKITQR
ncbi:MAG TPA: outer membrane protein assembly factor BamD [Candidatus Kapabacteria bacterium]|nr:outer membrane protein assembly factor BamD [Candidatus Kapabacteria bacterium]